MANDGLIVPLARSMVLRRNSSPEVEKALPEFIRQTLTHERDFRGKALRLLREHRKGSYHTWIERLRRIQRLSRRPRTTLKDIEQEPYFDSPPLPCVLVAFK